MKLLPSETFILHTSRPLPIVREKLALCVEPSKPFRWIFSRRHAPYEGEISAAGFRISRITRYRNSFLPIIQGEFQAVQDGTIVRVKMSVNPLTLSFLGFWIFVWYGITLFLYLAGSRSGGVALVFLGFPAVMYAICLFAFWSEVDRSRRELTQIITEE